TSSFLSNSNEVILDYLAAGLDPARSVLFVQSHVPQHAELHLLLSMITSLGWLERVPSYKEQQENLVGKDLTTYGFLGYPLLQAADILMYRADYVPVGEDQVPHVELTREIARRFNFLYCQDRPPVFPEPEAQLTDFPRLRGLDGNRMSKSVGNTILLTDPPEQIAAKVRNAYTDPKKTHKDSPGRPEPHPEDGHPGCVVWEYHRKFNAGEADGIAAACRAGTLGCVANKRHLAQVLTDALAPVRERRERYAADPARVRDIVATGNRRAREVAQATLAEVRDAMHLSPGHGWDR
ncbi:MAG TPA: tryptophan--tRNA ligase, partial [Candidatus Eisenbacteria bacterium]|nr:tryptophan--tRNA ligase [Candidatus Eisenbacteria bacterium]